MKGLKQKAIRSSINKWEGIRKDIADHDTQNYLIYWTGCGYCSLYGLECCSCPLRDLSAEYGISYCRPNIHSASVASLALDHATKKNFEEALKYVDHLLEKMYSDLEEVEKE